MRKKGMGKAAAVIAAAMLFSLFSEAGMAAPQMVQAATGIAIESKDNKVPTYKAGEKKTWTFTVTNHSGNTMNNVTVTPDLGDGLHLLYSGQYLKVQVPWIKLP